MDSQAEETKRVHNKRVDNLGYFCTTAQLELDGASMKPSAEQGSPNAFFDLLFISAGASLLFTVLHTQRGREINRNSIAFPSVKPLGT